MINLGKAIYSILSSNSAITNLVGNNIKPILFPENTPNEAIVYEKNSSIEYTKDGVGTVRTNLILSIRATSYEKSIEIAEQVFQVLNQYRGDIMDNYIVDVTLTSTDEYIVNNLFYQQLNFEIISN